MEISKSLYVIIIALGFFSCKKTPLEILSHNKIEISNKTTDSAYQEVNYVSKKLVNGIYVFDFKDKTITLQYGTSTLFGITDNHNFKIFSSQYDLDLGEINLLRFDNKNSQIYLVELKDYSDITYNLYYFENDQVYYLGTKDIDLSKQVKNKKNHSHKVEISKTENNISINLKINEKDFSKSNFEVKLPLKSLKIYSKIEDYLGNNTSNEDLADKNLTTNNKNEYFSINVNEDGTVTVNLKKEKTKYINSNILEGNMNCPDTSLDEIILKNNYFTIQKYNCNDKYFLKEYITFKQDKNGIFLHKYGVEQTDKYNPDKISPNKNYSKKDFGTIQFENVDKEFLRNLLSK